LPVKRATSRAMMPVARIPRRTQTQVGVELDELELVVVVGVVGASVVVCSTVVATVVAGAVVLDRCRDGERLGGRHIRHAGGCQRARKQ
jgi:hypothetical protein